jgi:protein pelota
MKLITKDFKKGFMKVKVESLDDLWYLSHIIDNGDLVSSITFRKIKLGDGDDRKAKIIKKKLWLKIIVEKIQFSSTNSSLRISGTINEGTDEIPTGSYHTLNIDIDSELEINKPSGLMEFQIKKINEATKNNNSNIIICVLDRDQALFALLKKYGYDIISRIKGEVERKNIEGQKKSDFFVDIVNSLKEYDSRYSFSKIIIGSPNFWKPYISNEIEKTNLKSKVVYSNCSADGENAIKEVLKRPETSDVLKGDRLSQEIILVDRLLEKIAKDGLVEYGISQVENAANLGCIETLLVSDNKIIEMRENDTYEKLDNILKLVDSSKGEIIIVSGNNEAGQKLDSLSGIGAFLRFRI